MTLKRLTIVCLALLAACGLVLAATATAGKPRAVAVEVSPDPNLAKAEADSGDDHDPYVLFELKNGTGGRLYRLITQKSPKHKADKPCTGGLNTQWHPASAGGEVRFPLEPMASGTYLPFASVEPCHGNYVMKVQERRAKVHDWTTVRRVGFSYPSFAVKDLPLHD